MGRHVNVCFSRKTTLHVPVNFSRPCDYSVLKASTRQSALEIKEIKNYNRMTSFLFLSLSHYGQDVTWRQCSAYCILIFLHLLLKY